MAFHPGDKSLSGSGGFGPARRLQAGTMQNRTGGNGGNGVFERATGKMLDDCMYHQSVSGYNAGSSRLFSLFSPVQLNRACWLWHSPSFMPLADSEETRGHSEKPVMELSEP